MNTADLEHEDGMSDGERGSWQTLYFIVEPLPGDSITPGGCVRVVNSGEVGDALVRGIKSEFEFGVPRDFAHKVSLN